jgi:hypothetical protein
MGSNALPARRPREAIVVCRIRAAIMEWNGYLCEGWRRDETIRCSRNPPGSTAPTDRPVQSRASARLRFRADRPRHRRERPRFVGGRNGINDAVHTRGIRAALPWIEMRGMRNKIIHDYFDVNVSVVWNTIHEDFPRLRKQIRGFCWIVGGSQGNRLLWGSSKHWWRKRGSNPHEE